MTVMIAQRRMSRTGELREWTLDTGAMEARISWVSGRRDRFELEAREMAEHFPTWVAALGRPGNSDYWDTGELLHHDPCGAPYIFDRGIRCVECSVDPPFENVVEPADRLLAFIGRIPASLGGRPWLRWIRRRIATLKSQGLAGRAARLRSYFIKVDGNPFFAPPVFAFYPFNWPHSDPLTMVESDYFDVLGLPASHTYPGTAHRLCNYATWRDVTLRTVLQQRIVPRVLIDVMLADLAAMGHLEPALEEAHLDMHSVYNVIGKQETRQLFGTVYERYREREST